MLKLPLACWRRRQIDPVCRFHVTQRDDLEPVGGLGITAAKGGAVKSRRLGQICVGANRQGYSHPHVPPALNSIATMCQHVNHKRTTARISPTPRTPRLEHENPDTPPAAKPCRQPTSSTSLPLDHKVSDATLFGQIPLLRQNRLGCSALPHHCRNGKNVIFTGLKPIWAYQLDPNKLDK